MKNWQRELNQIVDVASRKGSKEMCRQVSKFLNGELAALNQQEKSLVQARGVEAATKTKQLQTIQNEKKKIKTLLREFS